MLLSRLVIVADIVDSRTLSTPERRAVQARVERLAGSGLAFRYTGGDEFEWALDDAPASLDALLRFRAQLGAGADGVPAITLRCGVGRGTVTVTSERGPYAEDGAAYHRARAAYDMVRAAPTRLRRSHLAPFVPTDETTRRTAIDDGHADPARDALLVYMDQQLAQWTPAQWAAIDQILAGRRYEDAATALGVSAQAVHKRLTTAGLNLYLTGHQALKIAWRESRA